MHSIPTHIFPVSVPVFTRDKVTWLPAHYLYSLSGPASIFSDILFKLYLFKQQVGLPRDCKRIS